MIREYHSEDFTECVELLSAENVHNFALLNPDGISFVLLNKGEIVGFFTLTYLKKLPTLQHFVVRRTSRNKVSKIGFLSENALNLLKYLDVVIHKRGYHFFIISLDTRRSVRKVVRLYFKKRIIKTIQPKEGIQLHLVRSLEE